MPGDVRIRPGYACCVAAARVVESIAGSGMSLSCAISPCVTEFSRRREYQGRAGDERNKRGKHEGNAEHAMAMHIELS